MNMVKIIVHKMKSTWRGHSFLYPMGAERQIS